MDPIAYVTDRLDGRRLSPSARGVARVVAQRLQAVDGEHRTVGLRKRHLAAFANVTEETVQNATRALCADRDPIFEFRQVMERDPAIVGLVRAWSYVLRVPSQATLHEATNPPANTTNPGACGTTDPASSPTP